MALPIDLPERSVGKEALSALIRNATEHPEAWKTVAAFVEGATNKAAKGGVSIERVVQNEAGQQLVEHTVLDKAGKIIDQHFRPMLKPPTEP